MENKKPVAKKSPAKKTATKKATPKPQPKPEAAPEPKVEEKTDQVALFSEGKLFHPNLGRLTAGYNIVDPVTAQEWMKISPRVREATAQEVASAYGV